MATKLFQENDSWGDNSGNSLNFSSQKNVKQKKNRKRKRDEITEDFGEAGKWVRFVFNKLILTDFKNKFN